MIGMIDIFCTALVSLDGHDEILEKKKCLAARIKLKEKSQVSREMNLYLEFFRGSR